MLRKKLKLNTNNEISEITSCTSTTIDPNETVSSFFEKQFWQKLYDVQREMNSKFDSLHFSAPIAAVYNPTVYGEDLHCAYLKKYLTGPKSVVFLGMNPGPWGMCQTGVPFGHIPAVRDWLKLDGIVNRPDPELPARPVTGLKCEKTEQSGQRWWGLLEKLCGQPENLFLHCFIHNYCALAFFAASGRNITPSELKGDVKRELQTICNAGLQKALQIISPKIVVCIGAYTKDRMHELRKKGAIDETIKIECMPHPSPRSLNNTNWPEKAENWLVEHEIIQYFSSN